MMHDDACLGTFLAYRPGLSRSDSDLNGMMVVSLSVPRLSIGCRATDNFRNRDPRLTDHKCSRELPWSVFPLKWSSDTRRLLFR